MSIVRRVLVVDHSKLIRATLAKHLKDSYIIREESNGESAWQTLVLDSSIVAVVSGINLPKLDGYGLLERLRHNKLRRLSELPFLFLLSGSENEAEQAKALRCGASGFITKRMGKTDIVSAVVQLIGSVNAPGEDEDIAPQRNGLTATDVCGSAMLAEAAAWPELKPKELPPVSDGHLINPMGEACTAPLLTAVEIEAKMSLALSSLDVRRSAVSVVALGIDNASALAEEYGEEMVRRVGLKIAKLLRGKIGASDCVGQLRSGCLVIVARGSGLDVCVKFAERVCRSLASGQIGSEGNRVAITVSAGVASVPHDGGLSSGNLLLLAHRRLCQAIDSGGNRVVASGNGQRQVVPDAETLVARVLASLRQNRKADAANCLATAGLEIMPLLKVLEKEFSFGLPLEKMEVRLEQRALSEET